MHEHLHRLAQAAADNDAISEERGTEAAVAELGYTAEDVKAVAEQRALRAVLVFAGRREELARTRQGQLHGVALNGDEQRLHVLFTGIYMDGIAIGIRAEKGRIA